MAAASFPEFLTHAKVGANFPLKSHLEGVASTLVLQHPQNPLAAFESVSEDLKRVEADKTNLDDVIDAMIDQLDEKDLRIIKPDSPQDTAEFVGKVAPFFGFVKPETEDGTDPQDPPADPAPIGYVSDLLAEDSLFRKAGFGFGEKESFTIYSSLK